MADNRRYNKNVSTTLAEYHLLESPTSTQKANAYDVYTYVPIVEEISGFVTVYDIIKIDQSYHYGLLNTSEPSGQTWTAGTNLFTTLYDGNGSAITAYTNVSSSSPAFLKVGDDNSGYKYYQKRTGVTYYELCGKMPSSLKNGEIAVSRNDGHECMYIKNSDDDMIEFRNYKSQLEYVNTEIGAVYDLIYSIHYSPSWTASPSVIFKATNTSVTATAKLSFNGSAMSDFNASTPSGWTVGTTSGTSRTFTKTVNSTSNVYVTTTITKDAYSKTMSATIAVVNHIFYGASSDSSLNISTFANSGLTGYTTAVTSAVNRAYTVTMGTNQYFYIAVPAAFSSQPSQVGVGGASGFFEALEFVRTKDVTDNITGVTESYKFYRTQSTQTSGSHPYYVKS